MRIYQHDNSDVFRIRLVGRLDAEAALELERCFRCAASILGSRPIVVDISEVSGSEEAGLALLRSLREQGVLVTDAGIDARSRSRLSLRWPSVLPRAISIFTFLYVCSGLQPPSILI